MLPNDKVEVAKMDNSMGHKTKRFVCWSGK